MWQDSEQADAATAELCHCVRDCAACGVPTVIVHPYIGFEDPYVPTKAGLRSFGAVVELAAKLGVRIAFENVEGEEYLAALMEAFRSYDNVGFCWDSGHELCYNDGKDMLALYGDRLFATHLNDNLGISRHDGSIFWTDDLHLLPYDGIQDWDDVARRLCRHGYDGILTFELKRNSNPGRHDNEKYAALPLEQYVAEAYARACRLAYRIRRLRAET
jgi:sugar phosphate isomerase/epimerase